MGYFFEKMTERQILPDIVVFRAQAISESTHLLLGDIFFEKMTECQKCSYIKGNIKSSENDKDSDLLNLLWDNIFSKE